MKFCLRLAMLTAILFVGVSLVSAQTPNESKLWIYANVGSEIDTMIFGAHINATYGLDVALGELEGPPAPGPDGGWAMWIDPRGNNYEWGTDTDSHPYFYLKDFRHFSSTSQVDSFQLNVIPYTGTLVFLKWPDTAYLKARCDNLVMKDRISGGLLVNVNMMNQDTLTVSNALITNLLIVRGGCRLVDFVGAVRQTNPATPASFALHQNYPNPFNPTTTVSFAIAKASMAEIVVYDVLGRKISTLVSGQLNPGTYAVQWNGMDGRGIAAGSGLYFVRMTARANGAGSNEEFSAVRKVLLMK